MTSPAKLYARLLADPAMTVSFRDLERMLEAAGFVHKRTTGSHRHYKHPDVPEIFTASPNGKDANGYQKRSFLAIMREYGLGMEE